jgi:hypothetical protein
MEFRIDHTYEGIGFAEYQDLHFDETFNAALTASVNLGRTLLKLDQGADKLVRKVEVEPDRGGKALSRCFSSSAQCGRIADTRAPSPFWAPSCPAPNAKTATKGERRPTWPQPPSRAPQSRSRRCPSSGGSATGWAPAWGSPSPGGA